MKNTKGGGTDDSALDLYKVNKLLLELQKINENIEKYGTNRRAARELGFLLIKKNQAFKIVPAAVRFVDQEGVEVMGHFTPLPNSSCEDELMVEFKDFYEKEVLV